MDLEDDDRLEDCFLGEAPLMAASKKSRSFRLRNIILCVGVLRVVKCRCVLVIRSEGIPLSVQASARILEAKR